MEHGVSVVALREIVRRGLRVVCGGCIVLLVCSQVLVSNSYAELRGLVDKLVLFGGVHGLIVQVG